MNANRTDQLDQAVARWKARNSSESSNERLGDLARTGIDRLRAGDVGALLDVFDEFGEAMERAKRAAGLAILRR